MTSPHTQHRLDSLTTEQLRALSLPDSGLGRRGYEKTAVDQALVELANYIEALRVDLAATIRALRYREYEIEQRRHGVGLPASGHSGEMINEEQLSWHIEAQRYGDQITAIAQQQAAHIVEDAQAQADRILAASEQSRVRAVSGPPLNGHTVQLRELLRTMRGLVEQVAEQLDGADAVTDDLVRGKDDQLG